MQNVFHVKNHSFSSVFSRAQIEAMADVCRGEERRYMFSKLSELIEIVQTMPRTYETDGVADPIVCLHYFVAGCDWYIVERDIENEQLQAFGKADLGMGFPELGYISITGITAAGAELDLHWSEKPLTTCQLRQMTPFYQAQYHRTDNEPHFCKRCSDTDQIHTRHR